MIVVFSVFVIVKTQAQTTKTDEINNWGLETMYLGDISIDIDGELTLPEGETMGSFKKKLARACETGINKLVDGQPSNRRAYQHESEENSKEFKRALDNYNKSILSRKETESNPDIEARKFYDEFVRRKKSNPILVRLKIVNSHSPIKLVRIIIKLDYVFIGNEGDLKHMRKEFDSDALMAKEFPFTEIKKGLLPNRVVSFFRYISETNEKKQFDANVYDNVQKKNAGLATKMEVQDSCRFLYKKKWGELDLDVTKLVDYYKGDRYLLLRLNELVDFLGKTHELDNLGQSPNPEIVRGELKAFEQLVYLEDFGLNSKNLFIHINKSKEENDKARKIWRNAKEKVCDKLLDLLGKKDLIRDKKFRHKVNYLKSIIEESRENFPTFESAIDE